MDASKSKAARAAFILKTSFLYLLKVKSNLNMFTLSTACMHHLCVFLLYYHLEKLQLRQRMMLNPLQPINAAVSSLDYGIICTQTLDKLHEVQEERWLT